MAAGFRFWAAKGLVRLQSAGSAVSGDQMTTGHKIAYISRVTYPSLTAHALQIMQMAAAFARQTGDAHLFVRDLVGSEEQIRQQYGINEAPLRIWSMHLNRVPPRLRRYYRRANRYNFAIAVILGLHPAWWGASDQRKVLFVRSQKETLYWGLMRPYLRWLQNWTFICELHDLRRLLRDAEGAAYDYDSPRARKTVHALQNYDLLLAVTDGLVEDLQVLTHGSIQPIVVPLCTGLQRLDRQPRIGWSPEQVVLGYMGTVDLPHGIDDLFRAVRFLPGNCVLRIVGRVHKHAKAYVDQWMQDPSVSGRVELKQHVNYSEMVTEIDACDIVLAPAGDTIHSKKYRSPLKLFDYMARGKPIVAAGVPCHLELLQDGVNARIYQPGNPEDLAACIMSLVEQPRQAEVIARRAWEQAAEYTYDARAQRVLELVDEVWEQRHARPSA